MTKVREVEGAKGSAWFTDTKHNVFLDSGDDHFSSEHVRNRFSEKSNREIPTNIFFYLCLPVFLMLYNEKFCYKSLQAIAYYRCLTCL